MTLEYYEKICSVFCPREGTREYWQNARICGALNSVTQVVPRIRQGCRYDASGGAKSAEDGRERTQGLKSGPATLHKTEETHMGTYIEIW